MKEVKKTSYSSMKTLQNCEQEFWHYRLAKTPPDSDYEDSDALGFGSAFHQVLEKSMHNAFHKEHLIEAMEEHKVHEADMGPLMAMGRRYLQLHKLSNLKVIKCEQQIETPEFVGYIDMIMVGEDGSWWIGDLKTTSRFDEKNLIPRLPKDMQLNLYAHFKDWIARAYDLDPAKFAGCRYRAVTKPKIVQKGKESVEDYAIRVAEKVDVYDIEVPYSMMDPNSAWELLIEAHKRSLELQAGEVPRKNYNGCISYFKPCKYFSQCHGSLFSESHGKVKVHTIESFEGADAL
jgi:hypothetical protein